MKYYLAIDIGASSGRHIVGWCENNEIKTDEVYRFQNGMKKKNGHLVWDIEALYKSVVTGIKRTFKKYKQIESLAIDTWGCDYVLMMDNDELAPCLAYRDNRTETVIDKVHASLPFEKLYMRTGIQYQPFNTIYQLCEDRERKRLDMATDFLMIPEYLNYRLTDVKMKEYTNATTTGLVNASSGDWDNYIIGSLCLPKNLFTALHKPGETVGYLSSELAKSVGGNCKVLLCASHDTASAVEGIPMDGNELYISSGTWSLLGAKVPQAITDDNSRKANYSNEGGVGYIRYQKNIMGMWVVNRLKDEICHDTDFSEIINEARNSSFNDYVDINDNLFLSPASMKEAIDRWFENEQSSKPASLGDYFRCVFISLAIGYMNAIQELERNTGKTYSKLYIVGGGAKNTFLNELTEQTTQKQVIALPIEATALGNLKIQMEAER